MKKLLCLFTFFCSFAFSQEAIESVTLIKSTQSWDGSTMPAYPTNPPEITVLKITIPPHTKLPLHKHPIINVGYMLKGSLTVVTQSQKTLHLKMGDAIIEVVDTWHYGENEGDEPAEIVVVYAGTKESILSIK